MPEDLRDEPCLIELDQLRETAWHLRTSIRHANEAIRGAQLLYEEEVEQGTAIRHRDVRWNPKLREELDRYKRLLGVRLVALRRIFAERARLESLLELTYERIKDVNAEMHRRFFRRLDLACAEYVVR